MSKAKPFSESDEDEKTTIESQWEEEASTTIEQGELADKIASISPDPPRRSVTNITSTGAAALEEPTVDDQHANSAIAFPLQATGIARLAITQGNDLGREIEIFPGKSYTIGRGLDNDVVLTDIAVSRKHFDLRFEAGVWVIVDRGSGNGTIVNGNIEDNPFMLANGDVIEIGNTTFRFDQQGAEPRRQSSLEVDLDEEPSTVAGKPPLRSEAVPVVEAPLELPPELPPERPATPRERARTLPPPAPLRARSPSVQPAAPAPFQLPPQPVPLPGLAPERLPPERLAPERLAPERLAPERLAPASLAPMAMPAARAPLAPAPIQPQPQPTPAGMAPLAYRQPSAAQMAQPGPMAMPPGGRPALGSPLAPAMLVEPSRPSGGLPTTIPGQGMTPQRPMYNGYPQATEIPPHSLHAHLIMSQGGRPDASTAHVAPLSYGAPALAPLRPKSGVSLGTKILLGAAGVAVLAAIVTIAVAGGSSAKPAATAAKAKSAQPHAVVMPVGQHATSTVATPVPVTPVTHAAPATPVTHAAPETHEADTHPAPETHAPEPQHAEQTPIAHAEQPTHHAAPHGRVTHHATPTHRVATADTGDAERRATDLYGDQKFNEAGNVLEAAARTTDERDARRLRHTAQLYALVGRALKTPTSPANVAYEKLKSAADYDRAVGGGLSGEIRNRLGTIAPKAAIFYFSLHQYDRAHSAVRTAETLGAVDSTAKLVKQQLEAKAGELYGIASKELASAPDDAKSKLQLIENMVDASSPWYERADRLLKGNG